MADPVRPRMPEIRASFRHYVPSRGLSKSVEKLLSVIPAEQLGGLATRVRRKTREATAEKWSRRLSQSFLRRHYAWLVCLVWPLVRACRLLGFGTTKS